jgi:hypothetical protein
LKMLVDETDRVLARHYGFTDEELDFIINYDIKYRMGGLDEEEDQKLAYPTDPTDRAYPTDQERLEDQGHEGGADREEGEDHG